MQPEFVATAGEYIIYTPLEHFFLSDREKVLQQPWITVLLQPLQCHRVQLLMKLARVKPRPKSLRHLFHRRLIWEERRGGGVSKVRR